MSDGVAGDAMEVDREIPMSAALYQQLADRTNLHGDGYKKVQERMSDPLFAQLMHAAMGMVTEAAEFMDALKKHAIYGKPLDLVNLKEEIGDEEWYVALALNTLKTTYAEVHDTNIRKLKKRFPDSFTEAAALTRNLDAERKVLESAEKKDPFKVGDRVYVRRRDMFGTIEKLDAREAHIKFEWPCDPNLAAQPQAIEEMVHSYEAPERQ